jgi:hypothetical protein
MVFVMRSRVFEFDAAILFLIAQFIRRNKVERGQLVRSLVLLLFLSQQVWPLFFDMIVSSILRMVFRLLRTYNTINLPFFSIGEKGKRA